jgi:hypothetical protein
MSNDGHISCFCTLLQLEVKIFLGKNKHTISIFIIKQVAHVDSDMKQVAHMHSDMKQVAHVDSDMKQVAHVDSDMKQVAHVDSDMKQVAHVDSDMKQVAHVDSDMKQGKIVQVRWFEGVWSITATKARKKPALSVISTGAASVTVKMRAYAPPNVRTFYQKMVQEPER